jgi:tRNA threonylcarbamoyl adenosine modification protein YeaZ/ribosomal-protein-alanine acetyltransferase
MIRFVLALDTATPAVTAGVVRLCGDRRDVLAEEVTGDARAHAERLTPNVLAAMAGAKLTMANLDAVVVGCGPGPFTGLRVGMATAAAYGHALDIPVHPVCSLDAIGAQTSGQTLVVTDARRREVYWARYSDGVRTGGPGVDAPADVDPGSARAVAGSPEHAAMFELPWCEPAYPTPAGLVAVVADWSATPSPLVPLYLRRPDAQALAGGMSSAGPVTFGPLTLPDADRCAQLEALLFAGDDPWPAHAFARELAAQHNHYVAARVGDTLVGYAGICRLGRMPPFEYEVHTIGVDPAYQGQHVGHRLLDELLRFADGGVVHLEVRTDNAAAIALYHRAGFAQVGLRRRYYRASGADAYTMRRDPERRACP